MCRPRPYDVTVCPVRTSAIRCECGTRGFWFCTPLKSDLRFLCPTCPPPSSIVAPSDKPWHTTRVYNWCERGTRDGNFLRVPHRLCCTQDPSVRAHTSQATNGNKQTSFTASIPRLGSPYAKHLVDGPADGNSGPQVMWRRRGNDRTCGQWRI